MFFKKLLPSIAFGVLLLITSFQLYADDTKTLWQQWGHCLFFGISGLSASFIPKTLIKIWTTKNDFQANKSLVSFDFIDNKDFLLLRNKLHREGASFTMATDLAFKATQRLYRAKILKQLGTFRAYLAGLVTLSSFNFLWGSHHYYHHSYYPSSQTTYTSSEQNSAD